MGFAPEISTGKTLSTTFKNPAEEYLDVYVKNALTDPIPVIVTDGMSGAFHEDITGGITTPGSDQTLISGVVPAATTRNLEKVIIALRQESRWTLTADGDVIASGRTGANHPESNFEWSNARPLLAGTVYVLSLTARAQSQASDVEGYIFSSDTT